MTQPFLAWFFYKIYLSPVTGWDNNHCCVTFWQNSHNDNFFHPKRFWMKIGHWPRYFLKSKTVIDSPQNIQYFFFHSEVETWQPNKKSLLQQQEEPNSYTVLLYVKVKRNSLHKGWYQIARFNLISYQLPRPPGSTTSPSPSQPRPSLQARRTRLRLPLH